MMDFLGFAESYVLTGSSLVMLLSPTGVNDLRKFLTVFRRIYVRLFQLFPEDMPFKQNNRPAICEKSISPGLHLYDGLHCCRFDIIRFGKPFLVIWSKSAVGLQVFEMRVVLFDYFVLGLYHGGSGR